MYDDVLVKCKGKVYNKEFTKKDKTNIKLFVMTTLLFCIIFFLSTKMPGKNSVQQINNK